MAVTAQKPAASGAIASKALFADRVVDDLTGIDTRVSRLEGSGAIPIMVSESTANTGITSAAYITGTPLCEGTFIAPPSGRVMVQVGLNATGSNPQRIYFSWEMRVTNVSGAVAVAAADANGILTDWPNGAQVGGPITPVTGLTPGATYYVRTMHRVLGGSGSIFVRRITVWPA